jgi:hypothetical protein
VFCQLPLGVVVVLERVFERLVNAEEFREKVDLFLAVTATSNLSLVLIKRRRTQEE